MRTHRYLDHLDHNPARLVACFGSSQLVRNGHGRLEVRGGTDADRADARRWVERFLCRSVTWRVDKREFWTHCAQEMKVQGRVASRRRLGGMLEYYHRKAA